MIQFVLQILGSRLACDALNQFAENRDAGALILHDPAGWFIGRQFTDLSDEFGQRGLR